MIGLSGKEYKVSMESKISKQDVLLRIRWSDGFVKSSPAIGGGTRRAKTEE
jgi:hypothetical protein